MVTPHLITARKLFLTKARLVNPSAMTDQAANGSENSSYQNMSDAQLFQTIKQLTNAAANPPQTPTPAPASTSQVHPGAWILRHLAIKVTEDTQHILQTLIGGRTRPRLHQRMGGQIQLERAGQSRAAPLHPSRHQSRAPRRTMPRLHRRIKSLHQCQRLHPRRDT